MEFSSYQSFNFIAGRGVNVSEPNDSCFCKATSILCTTIGRSYDLLRLPDHESKFEGKLVVIADLKYEVRGGGG